MRQRSGDLRRRLLGGDGCRSASRSEQRPPVLVTCPTRCLSAPTKRCLTPNTAPARHGDQTARTRPARTGRSDPHQHAALGHDDVLDRSHDQTPGKTQRPGQRAASCPTERALLHELWRISHFGWIAHATLLRSLTISAGHQIADAALAGHLRQLLDRGWMEQRSNAAHADQREWRLTDSGRTAVRED